MKVAKKGETLRESEFGRRTDSFEDEDDDDDDDCEI